MINATTDNLDPKKMTGNNPVDSKVKKEELVSVEKKLVDSDPSTNTKLNSISKDEPNKPTPPKPAGFNASSTNSNEKPPESDNKDYKPKRKFNVKMIVGVFVLLLIIIGAVAGFYLSQQTQDLRQQAAAPSDEDECAKASCSGRKAWEWDRKKDACVKVQSDKCEEEYKDDNSDDDEGDSSVYCVDSVHCQSTLYDAKVVSGECKCLRNDVKAVSTPNPAATPVSIFSDSNKTCIEGYIGTTGLCVDTIFGKKMQRIYRLTTCKTETRDDGPTCTQDTAGADDRYPTPTPIGGLFDPTPIPIGGLFNPGVQLGKECNFDNPCADGLSCHCQEGDACTIALCESSATSEISCGNQGRSWCANWKNFAYTCCEPGYSCSDTQPGCFLDSATAPPATNPPGETRPPSTTPPATTPPPGEPICRDVAILDESNQVLNAATTPFSIGMVLKFRCAADDPNSQITNYEFQVTEPDGNIVNGSAINPVGSSAISLNYQIDQYLNHLVQCRACTGAGCQGWQTIN